jgi:hypothetical protein
LRIVYLRSYCSKAILSRLRRRARTFGSRRHSCLLPDLPIVESPVQGDFDALEVIGFDTNPRVVRVKAKEANREDVVGALSFRDAS